MSKLLITGGTGSFGNKLIETLLKYNIKFKSLIVYSRDEFKQYNMNIKFKSKKIKYFLLIFILSIFCWGEEFFSVYRIRSLLEPIREA